MSLENLLIFVPACFALNLAPGPNNLLSIANATRYGFWTSTVAGVGRLLAFTAMIAIAATGLAAVLQASLMAFYVIKFIGAAYLFYLAFQLWRAKTGEEAKDIPRAMKSLFALARQEFLVAAGNPKAILIFTAFLPQFIDIAEPKRRQVFNRICASLLGVAGIGLLIARRSPTA